MSNGKQTEVIVMDFAKAFDKVEHGQLIEQMKYYGVGGKTNKWIEDFLSVRSQRVELDGEKSYNADVLSGVPQGFGGPALTKNEITFGPRSILFCTKSLLNAQK